jgi:hypothetical protein
MYFRQPCGWLSVLPEITQLFSGNCKATVGLWALLVKTHWGKPQTLHRPSRTASRAGTAEQDPRAEQDCHLDGKMAPGALGSVVRGEISTLCSSTLYISDYLTSLSKQKTMSLTKKSKRVPGGRNHALPTFL